jgi:hypothetical protein
MHMRLQNGVGRALRLTLAQVAQIGTPHPHTTATVKGTHGCIIELLAGARASPSGADCN